eukprot:TRINITY_DN49716_c0_g1_i1.p1 TRINITY_DN49716_c0_g1~~TRINITY_DN49716_c0_g1_i1.p1  ORF type:complete len:286 (+),score=64.66 TRINITY_DN49716_c0_g1_i1:184-1041(+)
MPSDDHANKEARDGSEENASKAARVALPDRPPQAWMDAFANMFDSKIAVTLEPIAADVRIIKAAQTATDVKITGLGSRIVALESKGVSKSNASTASFDVGDIFIPTKLEIKGLAAADQRLTDGWTKVKVEDCFQKIKMAAPEELRSAFKKPIVFSARNTGFLIEIDSDNAKEVLSHAKDFIKENYPDVPAFVRLELPPWRRRANAVMAKALSFTEKHKGSCTVEVLWYPDFSILIHDTVSNKGFILMQLDRNDYVTAGWTEHAKMFFNLPSLEDVSVAFLKSSRR